MWFLVKRLFLGILLILLSSAILLVSDLDRRQPASERAVGRKWKVRIIQYNNVLDVEESERGIHDGLKSSGLVEGMDFEIKTQNAQGDMATVSSLIDAAVSEGADLLITMSTPTLQAALQRARNTPIVFTYLANAVAAGAGRSDTDHLPNVTGVYMMSPYEEMMGLVRECIPAAHTLGSLFVPAETNMVFHRMKLEEAAAKNGLVLQVMAANSSAEVGDAALAMCSGKIQAVCQMPGNLTAAAFPSIASAARKAGLPVFAFQTQQAVNGAAVTLARDFYDGARDAALLAARVMRGESPGAIPFQSVSKVQLIVNQKAAKEIGFQLPAALVARADEIIDERGERRKVRPAKP